MALLRCLLFTTLSLISAISLAAAIKDSRGRMVEPVSKGGVISGFVGADEILYELLKDEPERILALSPLSQDKTYSAIYQEAKAWPNKFGAELESLLKLRPKLVIVASFTRPDWLKMLDQTKTPSFVLGDFRNFTDLKENIRTLGRLVAKEASAERLVAKFESQMKRVKDSCPKKSRLWLNYAQNAVVHGKDTTFHAALSYLGQESVGGRLGVKGWGQVSRESLLKLQPDYLVVSGDKGSESQWQKKLLLEPGWKHLNAVKQGHIVTVPSRFLSSVTHHVIPFMETICASLKGHSAKN